DWMDGFYPYAEMESYLGLIALALAALGARAYRDRWVGCWFVVGLAGAVLMLGRYTFVMDYWNRVPILGSARIPVRHHLWVTLSVAALAAVGVDRLARPGRVSLRPAYLAAGGLIAASIPILVYIYTPAWSEASRWPLPSHKERFRGLSYEWVVGSARTAALVV